MKKKPKRLFKARRANEPSIDHGKRFHRALADVQIEDYRERFAALDALARIAFGEELSGYDVFLAAPAALFGPSPWPCMGCGLPCARLVCWQPGRTCLDQDFGCGEGEAAIIFYPACPACIRRCQGGDESWKDVIEVNALAGLRSEGAIPIAITHPWR